MFFHRVQGKRLLKKHNIASNNSKTLLRSTEETIYNRKKLFASVLIIFHNVQINYMIRSYLLQTLVTARAMYFEQYHVH